MNEFTNNANSSAYYCGAMMAVFAAIQKKALGDVGASVVQRYFGAAIQTPALVLGQLSKLSNHHLEKLGNGMRNIMNEYLEDLSMKIQGRIPTVLSTEEQSEFMLGYYQMMAKMRKDAMERKAALATN